MLIPTAGAGRYLPQKPVCTPSGPPDRWACCRPMSRLGQHTASRLLVISAASNRVRRHREHG